MAKSKPLAPKMPMPKVPKESMSLENMGPIPTQAPSPTAGAISKAHTDYERTAKPTSPILTPKSPC